MRPPESSESSMTQEVHIVPIGREFDRAVLPFLPARDRPPVLHAHRIHLIVPEADGTRPMSSKVERALRSIAVVEKHFLKTPASPQRRLLEFQQILEIVARLVHREIQAGHRVHINLSAGTKIFAFAAGLAGMAHLRPGLGSIYHVRPSGYSLSQSEMEQHGLTKGIIDVQELGLLPLLMPPALNQRILAYVRVEGDPYVEYRDLVKFLCDIPGSGYEWPRVKSSESGRRWNNAVTTRMVRTLIAPMGEEKLLELKSLGRQRAVRLTARGELYAALSALGRTDMRRPL